MPGQEQLEAALDETGGQVDAALRTTSAVTRELKKARAAAQGGSLRDLRRALGAAATLADDLATAARVAEGSFDVDEQTQLSSGAYAKELLATAHERGVAMFEEDERLLCYPSIIKLLPGDAALEVDRRREKRLRPSVVVDRLAAAQAKPPRFRPGPFLESLAAAYRLLVSREGKRADAVVKVVDVWGVLTLLPGQNREYTRPEFARDLYLLDQSGTTTTGDGLVLRWHASTGTRGAGSLTTVARTGQQQRYWGISFTGPS